MKTLFITNTYLVGNNGGVYASKAYINAFAKLSESFTLVFAMKDGCEPQDIITDHGITFIPIYDKRSRMRKFVDLCFGKVNRFQNIIFDVINISDFDTVVFNNSDASSGIIKKFKQNGIRTITIHHNYQIEYLLGDSNIITLLPNLFWTFIYERTAVRDSILNITLTNEDVNLLTSHYGSAKFAVLGVFEYQYLVNYITSNNRKRGHKYVITGWLGSKQTEDSIIPWIRKYYPLLLQIDPAAELTIAGRNPSNKLCSIAKENGICVIDSPINMQPILNESDYYICPTDRGGGLKLRILDGLKSGLPVLSNIVSARGYEYMRDSGLIFAYNNTKTFIDGVRAMINCNKDKGEIIENYYNHYSLEYGINRLSQILKESNIY